MYLQYIRYCLCGIFRVRVYQSLIRQQLNIQCGGFCDFGYRMASPIRQIANMQGNIYRGLWQGV